MSATAPPHLTNQGVGSGAPIAEKNGPESNPNARSKSASDELIETRIDEACRALWWAECVRRCLRLVQGILVALFAWIVIDQWIYSPSPLIRTLGFAFGSLAVAVYLYRYLWSLRGTSVQPEYAARSLERNYPELRHALTSYVTLRPHREDGGLSGRVVRSLGSSTAGYLQKRDELPLEATGTMRWWIATAIMLAGLLLYAALSPKDSLQSATRLLAPIAEIAPATRVSISDVTPGDTDAIAGRTIEVRAKVQGNSASDDMQVRVELASGTKTYPLVKSDDPSSSNYQSEISLPTSAAGNVPYSLFAGDATAGPFVLRVEDVPVVSLESIRYEPPAYTGITPYSRTTGAISAIDGTQITIVARCNRPVTRGAIQFNPKRIGNNIQATDGAIDLKVSQDGMQVNVQFPLKIALGRSREVRRDSYRIKVWDAADSSNPEPIIYPIDIIADLAPEIAIMLPTRSSQDVPLGAQQMIEVHASDADFGLTEIRLQMRSGIQVIDEPVLWAHEKGKVGNQVAEYRFRPAEMGLMVGDVVRIAAIATDNRRIANGDANTATTDPIELRIVADAEVPPPGQPNEDGLSEPDQQPAADPAGDNAPDEEASDGGSPDGNSDGNSDGNGKAEEGDQQGAQGQSGGSGDSADQQQSGGTGGDGTSEKEGEGDAGGGGKSGEGGESEASESEGMNQDQNSGTQDSTSQNSGTQNQNSGTQNPGDPGSGAQGSDGRDQGAQEANDDQSGQGDEPQPRQPDGSQDGDQRQSSDQGAMEPGTESKSGTSSGSEDPGSQSSAEQPSSNEPSSDSPNRDPDSSGSPQTDGAGNQQNGNPQNRSQDGTNPQGEGNPTDTQTDEQEGPPQHDGEAFERIRDFLENQKKGQGDQSGKPQEQSSDENRDPEAANPQSHDSETSDSETSDSETSDSETSDSETSDSESNSAQESGDRDSSDASSGGKPKPNDSANPSRDGDDGKPEGGGQGDSPSQPGSDGQRGDGNQSSGNQSDDNQSSGGQNPQSPQTGSDPNAESAADSMSDDASRSGDSDNQGTGGESPTDENTAKENATGEDPNGDSDDEGTGNESGNESGKESPEANSGSQSPSSDAGSSQSGSEPNGEPTPGKQNPENMSPSMEGTPGSTDGSEGNVAGEQIQDPVDKINQDYAKKATDMVLDYLDQTRDQPNQELLDKLNWTEADMQRFRDRWQNIRELEKSPTQNADAKRDLEDALRSLGLKPPSRTSNTQNRDNRDALRGLRDSGNRRPPPAAYRDAFDAFRRALAQ
ncbi:hypothetical protein Pla22_20390 [Rubripirellula amarantea]|uniref:Uncharacterized protein n=1 Tax=Rubripirellula amarantea TaxID=2527999 RepID=A0A5C5WWZ9_9BACT|nr:hypothetical protein [Rubripirellula amarantea]TWT54392.1 hypothetical protein Pla22_20390 [Rubripirellula amarantea]